MCDVPGFENCRMKLLRHVSFVDCPVRILYLLKLLSDVSLINRICNYICVPFPKISILYARHNRAMAYIFTDIIVCPLDLSIGSSLIFKVTATQVYILGSMLLMH